MGRLDVMRKIDRRLVLGWVALSLGTLVSSFWAFWGTVENFHEGWYSATLARNLLWTLAYLGPMLATMLLSVVAVLAPRAGGLLYGASALAFSVFLLRGRASVTLAFVLSWLPFTLVPILLGLLYAIGRARPRRWALAITIATPLAVSALCAVEPVLRIAGRIDDGDRGERLVAGHDVRLVWAPAGPGWVRDSAAACDWYEAARRCRHLSRDGKELAAQPQDVWRLPTVEEAVRSMARHGGNCRGTWDARSGLASYDLRPDKESPLWDMTSPIIYWWTATERDAENAYRIVYHGGVFTDRKTLRLGSLGFRAVKAEPRDD